VVIRLRGRPVTCALFAFRMSFSGKAVHRVFLSGGQEAFLEGHTYALAVLGGVPTGRSATTTPSPPSSGCSGSPAPGSRPIAGPCSARTTTYHDLGTPVDRRWWS